MKPNLKGRLFVRRPALRSHTSSSRYGKVSVKRGKKFVGFRQKSKKWLICIRPQIQRIYLIYLFNLALKWNTVILTNNFCQLKYLLETRIPGFTTISMSGKTAHCRQKLIQKKWHLSSYMAVSSIRNYFPSKKCWYFIFSLKGFHLCVV